VWECVRRQRSSTKRRIPIVVVPNEIGDIESPKEETTVFLPPGVCHEDFVMIPFLVVSCSLCPLSLFEGETTHGQRRLPNIRKFDGLVLNYRVGTRVYVNE
jgi:hypothetical protein